MTEASGRVEPGSKRGLALVLFSERKQCHSLLCINKKSGMKDAGQDQFNTTVQTDRDIIEEIEILYYKIWVKCCYPS